MKQFKALILLGLLATSPVIAVQSATAQARADQTESRILRLENEIQTLSRAIYRGERPVQTSRFGQGTAQTGGDFSALSQRLTSMENELRRLIGQIEQQSFKIRQLEQRLSNTASHTQSGAAQTTAANEVNATNGLSGANEVNAFTDNDFTPQPEPQPNQLGTLVTNSDGNVQTATINGNDMGASRLYDQAFADLQQGQYAFAEEKFFTFLSSYPDSPLTANAQYWLSETQFIQNDYDGAARNFALGYQKYPNSPKAPDNLLKLGLSLSQLGQTQEACVTLSELFSKYPQAPRSVLDKAVAEQKSLSCG